MSASLHQEFISNTILRIKDNLRFIETCLDKLEEKHLWQKPNEATNAIGNQVLHICGNMAQYTFVTLQKQIDKRERDAEFTNHHLEKSALHKRLINTVAEAISAIENASEIELNRMRIVQGFQFSGLGCVLHAVEHFSYHTGQIALQTKLITNQQLHFWEGFDLNAKNTKLD